MLKMNSFFLLDGVVEACPCPGDWPRPAASEGATTAEEGSRNPLLLLLTRSTSMAGYWGT